MSRIQIVCDWCGVTVIVSVRQPHEARQLIAAQGWTTKAESGTRWSKKGCHRTDYCSECMT